MSSSARKQPVTLQSVACLWLGQQVLMTMTAKSITWMQQHGTMGLSEAIASRQAGLAGLATETQTADGLPDDVYLHETVIGHIRHGLDHRFPATPLGRRATSSPAAWPKWSRTSIRTTSQAVLAADWRHWRRLCTGAVREWWSCRAGGCAPERQARSAGKARADR